jgi:hypothetical protein
MFKIIAKKGQLDLSMFDLQKLTDTANQTAVEIDNHNTLVEESFLYMVKDYLYEMDEIMGDIGLPCFRSINWENFPRFYVTRGANGLSIGFQFGHGRGNIKVYFKTDRVDGRLSFDFKGTVEIYKYWLRGSNFNSYKLESVAQIFDLGADVLKLHIINRDVRDFDQKDKLEKLLTY